MARIQTVETGLYRIPLTVTLSDSTHGEIDGLRARDLPRSRCGRR